MASVSESQSRSQSFSDSYIPEYSESAILQEIAQHARAMSDTVYNWGMDRFNQNQGNIDGLMRDALSYASPQRIAVDMGMAEAGVQQAAERGRQSAIRDLESYGIDPSSGRYAALDSANRVMSAAAAAGAGNQQRMADQAAGNAMRNQALAAAMQNAQFGVGVGDSANRFLQTGMQLKYPPLGRFSTSESKSESRSVTTDPAKSPQGGGEGGGQQPRGGGERPPPKPKEEPKKDPPPKPPKGGKGGKGPKGDKPAGTEDTPFDPDKPYGPDATKEELARAEKLEQEKREAEDKERLRLEDEFKREQEQDLQRIQLPEETPPYTEDPRYDFTNPPAEPPVEAPPAPPPAPPPPAPREDFFPTEDDSPPGRPLEDIPAYVPPTSDIAPGYRPYSDENVREAAFTVESNINPATGEPIERTADEATADPTGGLLTGWGGGPGDVYDDIGRGRLATEEEVAAAAPDWLGPDAGTDVSAGPGDYDSTYDTFTDAEGIERPRDEDTGPGLETGYGEEPGYDFAETGEIAPGAAEPEPAADYGEEPGYDFGDQDYGEEPGYDFGEEPTPEAPEEPDYGEDPGYDFQDYGDDSYEDYTDDDYSEDEEEDYGGDEEEDYGGDDDYEDSGDYEGESAARGGAVMRGRMRDGIRRARVMPPRTGYQFGGPIPPRRPGQRPRRLAPPPRPPQAPRPARGAPMPMRGGPQPTPMGRAPLMPGNFISPNGMPPPAVGGMQRPVQRMAQGGQAGRRAEPTQGGFVSRELSPSGGSKTDDVNARLNAGEFVVPKDVTKWLGQAHFYDLIAKARKKRAESSNGRVSNGGGGTGYNAGRGMPR